MLLEPFYTERNWTTKNQVLAYQRKFVNADTHREILLSQNFILCKLLHTFDFIFLKI